ncbi:hypothetical protein MMC30_003249 [Trapelia coarctata]|nr:hypothetical protein [Trapelia coarctata]
MEVDRSSFHWQLPRMLRALAKAHFVAVDFELSGIQSKTIHRAKGVDKHQGRKQTLQQRYEEVKEAAEKYQILQVGLTIVIQDEQTGKYIARPYNFFLNPILEEKLDIERIFSYQSGAVEFLLGHKFNMGASFTKGVAYLSREEEATAMEIEVAKRDRFAIPDIHLRSDEVESLTFVRRVREEIEKWKSRKTPHPEYINIAPEGHAITHFTERGLNGYQKRLVHQLVRAEHPDLVSISRAGFIQIMKYDEKREDAIKQQKMEAFKEKVTRQVGLRWVVEGMCGGSLDNLNPIMFAKGIEGKPVWIDLRELKRAHEEVKENLKNKRAVLVGHNLFMDLINFYKCFFGQLPDTVEEFQAIIHKLFPLIIDTKYMVTHNNSNPNPRSSLEELDADLHKEPVPVIELHPEHPNYKDMVHAHEAGYDSFTTAKVLIRLSAKLEAAGYYTHVVESEEEGWHTPPEEGGVLINLASDSDYGESSSKKHTPSSHHPTSHRVCLTEVTNLAPAAATMPKSKKAKKPKKPKKETTKPKSAFAHFGMFDLLEELNMDGADKGVDFEDMEDDNEETPLLAAAPNPDGWKIAAPPALKSLGECDQHVSQFMPVWKSDFWNVYGNKLRVNGTVEGICDLTGGVPRR